MTATAKLYIENWVSANVHNDPTIDRNLIDGHIKKLATALSVSASRDGITARDLEEAAGDLEDYLREAFENVFDPTAGGVKD
jgi:hypothetical protein